MEKNIIEVKNLTKYYGKCRGIEDISFSVEKGEIFGFIGPNGAGKSTTIRTLLALIHPTSGSACIWGRDCIKYAPELAKQIGYLPAEVFYYENMKVKDLLKYSAQLYKKDCSERIRGLSERLKLDQDRKISDLSYGNRKKVGIVQGLLHSPGLIILDEPTGGLDPLMQQVFFEIIKEENKKGATIFFSSHILSEVQKMCSRVAILKEGRILTLQKIDRLREEGYRKVHMELSREISERELDLQGIADFASSAQESDFLFRGNVAKLLSCLGRLPILNVTIEEPSLEEVFLHYYK